MKNCGSCKWFDSKNSKESRLGIYVSQCDCPIPDFIYIENLYSRYVYESNGTECETYEAKS